MLELDLLLEPFVNERYQTLDDANRARFQQLMLCEDQDLFTWFLGRMQPEDEDIANIVKQILEFSSTRTHG